MSDDLTADSAVAIISSAFLPLRCGAEHWDHRYRIRFRVYDPNDNPLLGMEELLKPQFKDRARLKATIIDVRDRIEQKAFELLPWSFPNN